MTGTISKPSEPVGAIGRRSLLLAPLLAAGCGHPLSLSSGIVLPDRLTAATAEPALWPDPDWWRGFNSPELDGFMQTAIVANFDIRAAEARIRQADAQIRIVGQGLLPSGNIGGNVTRTQTPVATASSFGGGGRRFVQRTTYNASLNASYEIDFWGKNRSAVEAARQSAIATRYDVAAITLTTQASVANTYFQIIASREQLAIQQQNLEAAERILALLGQQQTVGTATGLDVAQQQTLVDQQRAALPPLRQSIDQNTASLGTLTGQVPQRIPPPLVPLADLRIPPVQAGLPAEVLVRRPDVWLAEANLASAQANVINARSLLLPSVTLSATGGFQSLVIENLLRPGSALYSLVAGLTQPVFQLGQLRAQVRLTEAQAEELLENYRLAVIAALVDVENAIVALRDTTEQEQLQASATRSAEAANTISEAQLRAGTINLITLLLTQQTLFNARNTLVQVRLARLQAAVGVFRALGGGWA